MTRKISVNWYWYGGTVQCRYRSFVVIISIRSKIMFEFDYFLYSLLPLLIAGLITGRLIGWLFPAEATLLPGLPLLGNVVALGRLGAALLHQAHQKAGRT